MKDKFFRIMYSEKDKWKELPQASLLEENYVRCLIGKEFSIINY